MKKLTSVSIALSITLLTLQRNGVACKVTVPPGDYEVWVERGGKRVSTKSEAITLKVGECSRKVLTVEFRP